MWDVHSHEVIPEIEEIRLLRRQLGVTQQELAKRAGVSQSLIAKIERNLVQPGYENVKRILEVLEHERARRQPERTVGQCASKHLVWVDAHLSVKEAGATMRKHGYSQLPVRKGEKFVGSLSDRRLSELLSASDRPDEVARRRVEDVMEEPFPILPDGTPLQAAAALLRFTSAVLVSRNGEHVGVLTKSDLLKVLAK